MRGAPKLLMVCLVVYVGISLSWSTAAAQDVVVIANKDAPSDILEPDAIKKIFLGDIINWENNDVIMVALLEEKEIHEAFLKKYIKRTSSQFENVWRRNLFTGKGAMSMKLKSADEIVGYVQKTKGAIGYVPSETTLPADVKVVGK